MGKLHHAMTGTGAIAIAVAAALPKILAEKIVSSKSNAQFRIGHPLGRVEVGAVVERRLQDWFMSKAVMSRTARRIIEGFVLVPDVKEEKVS